MIEYSIFTIAEYVEIPVAWPLPETEIMTEKKTLHILLADDDEDDRMIFSDIVQQIEDTIQLHTVSDGQQLIRWLTANESPLPDVIFLDLNMPNKNGKACLKEIKANPAISHLPVIIYSTSGSEKDIREAYHQGASLYIQKPSNISGLRKTLTQVLSMDWQNGRPGFAEDNFWVKTAMALRQLFTASAMPTLSI